MNDKMKFSENTRFCHERDLNFERARYFEAKLNFIEVCNQTLGRCVYCDKKFFLQEAADHHGNCRKHPVAKYKTKIEELENSESKVIKKLEARIKAQKTVINKLRDRRK